MSVSKYIKGQGLPSVVYVAGKANVNRQILYSWYHNNFALFEVVVAGVKALDDDAAPSKVGHHYMRPVGVKGIGWTDVDEMRAREQAVLYERERE